MRIAVIARDRRHRATSGHKTTINPLLNITAGTTQLENKALQITAMRSDLGDSGDYVMLTSS